MTELKKEIQGKDKITSEMSTKLQGVEERSENIGIHKRKNETKKIKSKKNFSVSAWHVRSY